MYNNAKCLALNPCVPEITECKHQILIVLALTTFFNSLEKIVSNKIDV